VITVDPGVIVSSRDVDSEAREIPVESVMVSIRSARRNVVLALSGSNFIVEACAATLRTR